MKTLKKKSFKSVLIIILALWGAAIFLACAFLPSLLTALKEPTPLESVDFNGDIDGLYVSGTLYGIYDWYLEEYEDNKIIAKQYIIDADENYYICLRASNKDMNPADQLVDAYYQYWAGEDDGTLLTQAQYGIQGVVKPIPTEDLEILYEYLEWETMDEAAQATFLPYYIDVNSYGRYNKENLVSLIVVSGICFLLGCLVILWILTGHYQKSVKKYIASSSSPDLAREQVDKFIQDTPEIKGLRYNSNFVCGHHKGTTAFGETAKLAWVYLYTVTHRRNFITIGKSHLLMLCFTDGTKQAAEVKSEEIAKEHMENLAEICPQTIFGYSDELNKMFSKNLPGFLELRYQKSSGQ